jgi:hypothetical protein
METFEVPIESRWVKLVRSPFYHVIAALSGVAVTFCPAFLYEFGRQGADYGDWRVVACWLTTVIIGAIHFRLSMPLMRAIRAAPARRAA